MLTNFLPDHCCGGRTRTCDLQVMSLASYQLLHSAIFTILQSLWIYHLLECECKGTTFFSINQISFWKKFVIHIFHSLNLTAIFGYWHVWQLYSHTLEIYCFNKYTFLRLIKIGQKEQKILSYRSFFNDSSAKGDLLNGNRCQMID